MRFLRCVKKFFTGGVEIYRAHPRTTHVKSKNSIRRFANWDSYRGVFLYLEHRAGQLKKSEGTPK